MVSKFFRSCVLILFITCCLYAGNNCDWQKLYPGLEYAKCSAERPCLQKIYALRIDLHEPNISFFTTPSNGNAPLETTGQTTAEFLEQYKLQAAINANFFSPWGHSKDVPEDKDVDGLAISNGSIVSPNINADSSNSKGSELILISKDNKVTFTDSSAPDVNNLIANSYTAISGSHILLKDGENQFSKKRDKVRHPRTAIGLSKDKRYLYFMAIDGRQKGYSMGATLYETAIWLKKLGASDGINLDGGGSTTMVIADANDKAVVLNKPSDGFMRKVANSIGVFAKKR